MRRTIESQHPLCRTLFLCNRHFVFCSNYVVAGRGCCVGVRTCFGFGILIWNRLEADFRRLVLVGGIRISDCFFMVAFDLRFLKCIDSSLWLMLCTYRHANCM